MDDPYVHYEIESVGGEKSSRPRIDALMSLPGVRPMSLTIRGMGMGYVTLHDEQITKLVTWLEGHLQIDRKMVREWARAPSRGLSD